MMRCQSYYPKLDEYYPEFLQRTKCKKKARESQIGCVDFRCSGFKKGPA
jgi:hypothetical protein